MRIVKERKGKKPAKNARTEPDIKVLADLSMRDAAVLFNKGYQKFQRLFFSTTLCDNVRHHYTGLKKSSPRLNLYDTMKAAFPEFDEAVISLLMYQFLNDQAARRSEARQQQEETMKLNRGA